MTKQTEAMKLAKAWFERNTYGDEAVDVYEALCEALAEQSAQQEPEWYHFVRYGEDCFVPYSGQAPEKATPLYISPQRTWVGLTDEETGHWAADFFAGAKWAEAKLKEKNA